jgi:hypothetical protein
MRWAYAHRAEVRTPVACFPYRQQIESLCQVNNIEGSDCQCGFITLYLGRGESRTISAKDNTGLGIYI